MELEAFGRMTGVPQAHRDAARAARGDPQVGWPSRLVDDQRVVAGRGEARREAGQHTLAVVADGGGHAVHRLRRGDDPATVRGGDGLVAQADAEQWGAGRAGLDGADADPRVGWRARAG